jgi:hypothetical protein
VSLLLLLKGERKSQAWDDSKRKEWDGPKWVDHAKKKNSERVRLEEKVETREEKKKELGEVQSQNLIWIGIGIGLNGMDEWKSKKKKMLQSHVCRDAMKMHMDVQRPSSLLPACASASRARAHDLLLLKLRTNRPNYHMLTPHYAVQSVTHARTGSVPPQKNDSPLPDATAPGPARPHQQSPLQRPRQHHRCPDLHRPT